MSPAAPTTATVPDVRARIIDAATRLLAEGGADAVTTRRVADLAGVQAPALYRLFGDKDGLLDVVAEHVLATYVASKAEVAESAEAAESAEEDPVEDLRAGWQAQVEFGLANPAVFRLLHDPDRAAASAAAEAGRRVLAARVRRLARAGRLRVPEARAADLVHAAGTGVVLTLLAVPPEQRDLGVADELRDAVLAQVLTDAPAADGGAPLSVVLAMRALVPQLQALSGSERALLDEWLDRVAQDPPERPNG